MSLAPSHHRLELPQTLETQLHEFRRRVWTIKILEAVAAATFGVVVGYLTVFGLDRLWDTPVPVRLGVFVAALAVCTVVPYHLHRWVWRQRRLEQLARLLSRKLPRVGDQLLGVIELAIDESEQARSPALCQAAMDQVATDAKTRDFRQATPDSRHRMCGWLASTSLVAVAALFLLFPGAATNALARFATPWQDTPRYTFAAVQELPERMVVPHGEPFTVSIRLNDGTRWQPATGQVRLGSQQPVQASLDKRGYAFEMPPQIDSGSLHVRIGDFKQVVKIEPTLRPELASVVAHVSLPEYLGRPEPQDKDVRGGAISLVKGSTAAFSATANRRLTEAKVDGQPTAPNESTVTSEAMDISETKSLEFQWQDEFGLAGKEPFTLTVNAIDDEAPTLVCEDLPRRKIILDSEQLRFGVKAHDDFGIKRIGMQWSGVEGAIVEKPAEGERMLVAGDYDQVDMSVAGTFTASSLGIEPQPIQLRIFAEDYLPNRERTYSATYVLFVLSPEQHAIWMTEQLSKWHRQALEVRDRELTLYETNKQLRALTPEELDHPDTRQRIEQQAAGERANSNNLSRLTKGGEELIKNASRNPEFGVGHLEKWAQMLQILKDISANRMPSVADLLKQAAEAKQAASAPEGEQPPTVGQVRATGSGQSPEDDKNDEKKPPVPAIVDLESSQQPKNDKEDAAAPPNKSQGTPRLSLPVTTLLGGGPKGDQACPAEQKMEEAVTQQEDLLAEFEKVANELNSILANLEGSTLVKRLKAESRNQYKVAGRIADHLDNSFGVTPARLPSHPQKTFDELAKSEEKSSQTVSLIMDDMSAYFERRRFMRFKTVLEDMKGQDVVGGLRQLGDDIPKEQGLSIAQCEFWSDALDRWAEDLVDPAKGGT